MSLIPYSVSVRKFSFGHEGQLTYRCFVPDLSFTDDDSAIELDDDFTYQDGELYYIKVVAATGAVQDALVAAGYKNAHDGDVIPELSLRFIHGEWYRLVGRAL